MASFSWLSNTRVCILASSLGAVFCLSISQSTCWGSKHVKWASPSQACEEIYQGNSRWDCFSISECGLGTWDFCQEWYPSMSDYSAMVGARGATSSSFRGGQFSWNFIWWRHRAYSTVVQLFRKRSHIIIMYFCPQTRSPQCRNTHILHNAV